MPRHENWTSPWFHERTGEAGVYWGAMSSRFRLPLIVLYQVSNSVARRRGFRVMDLSCTIVRAGVVFILLQVMYHQSRPETFQ